MPLIKTITSGNCSSLVYNDAGLAWGSKHLVSDIWHRTVFPEWTGDVEFWRKWTETIDPPGEDPYQNKFCAKVHTATHYVVRSEYRYVNFRHQYWGREAWWRDNNGDNLDYPWFDFTKPRCSCIPIVNGTDDWIDDPTWTNQDPPIFPTIVKWDDDYGTWPIYYVRVIFDGAVWVDPVTFIQDNNFRTMGARVNIRLYAGSPFAWWEGRFQRGKYTTLNWMNNIRGQIPSDCDIVTGDYEYVGDSNSSSNSGYFFGSYRTVNDPGTLTVHSTDPI